MKTLNWIAAVGGVLGLLALFIPDVPTWMRDNGLGGWVTALVLLILAPMLTSATVRSRMKIQQLEKTREQSAKDIDLISELLDGWTIESDFFETLVEFADHNYFPVQLSRQIEDRWTRWNRESRQIKTIALNQTFKAVKEANSRYHDVIGTYMWEKDSGPGTTPRNDLLSVPYEWDRAAKSEAHAALNDARSDLVRALGELYAMMHELR